MRCGDVIRELSAPTGRLPSAAAIEHLNQCARCASWAARDARLGRLWEATQPEPLTDAAWERIWSHVTDTLDRPKQPARPRPWYRSTTAVLVVGQAAAILLGFALLFTERSGNPKQGHVEATVASAIPSAPHHEAAAAIAELSRYSQEPGQTLLISIDNHTERDLSADLARNDNPNGVDPFLSLYNTIEGTAFLQ